MYVCASGALTPVLPRMGGGAGGPRRMGGGAGGLSRLIIGGAWWTLSLLIIGGALVTEIGAELVGNSPDHCFLREAAVCACDYTSKYDWPRHESR